MQQILHFYYTFRIQYVADISAKNIIVPQLFVDKTFLDTGNFFPVIRSIRPL